MEAADFCRKKEQGKKMKKMMEKNTVEERKENLTEEDQKKEICDAEKQQEKLRFECRLSGRVRFRRLCSA